MVAGVVLSTTVLQEPNWNQKNQIVQPVTSPDRSELPLKTAFYQFRMEPIFFPELFGSVRNRFLFPKTPVIGKVREILIFFLN
jgi:hypothetical protein